MNGAVYRGDNAAVSVENVQVVRLSYEAYARGDAETSLSYFDPGVEFSQPVDEPGGGTYHGIDGVIEAFANWVGPWDDYRVEVEGITHHGEHVLARTRHRMRGKSSGVQVDKVIFQLWTLRSQKIVRVKMYYDEAEALAAAGIDAPQTQPLGQRALGGCRRGGTAALAGQRDEVQREAPDGDRVAVLER